MPMDAEIVGHGRVLLANVLTTVFRKSPSIALPYHQGAQIQAPSLTYSDRASVAIGIPPLAGHIPPRYQ